MYNRKKLVEKIVEMHDEYTFEHASKSIAYDILLVINGCTRSCADIENYSGNVKITVGSENDFCKVVDIIDRLKEEI